MTACKLIHRLRAAHISSSLNCVPLARLRPPPFASSPSAPSRGHRGCGCSAQLDPRFYWEKVYKLIENCELNTNWNQAVK
jgi:hypothetical protein